MELKLGVGINDLKFGMTQDEIIEKLGAPDRMKEDIEDEDTLFLEYFDKKLRLSVYRAEGNRLGYMTCSNLDLEYKGQQIISAPIEDAKSNIFGSVIEHWESDEYDLFDVYGNDKYWITLNVEYGAVISLELGVMINDEDDFVWPA